MPQPHPVWTHTDWTGILSGPLPNGAETERRRIRCKLGVRGGASICKCASSCLSHILKCVQNRPWSSLRWKIHPICHYFGGGDEHKTFLFLYWLAFLFLSQICAEESFDHFVFYTDATGSAICSDTFIYAFLEFFPVKYPWRTLQGRLNWSVIGAFW